MCFFLLIIFFSSSSSYANEFKSLEKSLKEQQQRPQSLSSLTIQNVSYSIGQLENIIKAEKEKKEMIFQLTKEKENVKNKLISYEKLLFVNEQKCISLSNQLLESEKHLKELSMKSVEEIQSKEIQLKEQIEILENQFNTEKIIKEENFEKEIHRIQDSYERMIVEMK